MADTTKPGAPAAALPTTGPMAAPAATNGSTPPQAPTDAELERLRLEDAKETLRKSIAASRLATIGSLVPDMKGAPTGVVTLGEKAGSLGPWLAHRTATAAAAGICAEICADDMKVTFADDDVVLVTDDPALLAGDVLTSQVRSLLEARTDELERQYDRVATALHDLNVAITEYTTSERPTQPGGGHEVGVAAVELQFADADKVLLLVDDAKADEDEQDGAPKGKEQEGEKGAAAGAGDEAAGANSYFGAAVDLVQLLATDYTVTASTVTVRSSTLATVTAGMLGAKLEDKRGVVLDGFTVTGGSPILDEYAAVTSHAQKVSLEVQKLTARAAGVAAEAAQYQAEADKLLAAWTAATGKETPPQGTEKLKAALDERTARVARRTAAAKAAQDAGQSAAAVVSAARADLTALTTPSAAGVLPLVRACSREGLHVGSPHKITHVLLVEATNAGADVVTRRSTLSASGRVNYLAGVNVTWALAEAKTGQIVGGGAQNPAHRMVQDLGSWRGKVAAVSEDSTFDEDPFDKQQGKIRAAVLLLALGIALLGLSTVVSVIARVVKEIL